MGRFHGGRFQSFCWKNGIRMDEALLEDRGIERLRINFISPEKAFLGGGHGSKQRLVGSCSTDHKIITPSNANISQCTNYLGIPQLPKTSLPFFLLC